MALSKEARDFFIAEGRKGGQIAATRRTAAERSEAARKAVNARWAKADRTLAEIDRTLSQIDSGSPKKAGARKRAGKK